MRGWSGALLFALGYFLASFAVDNVESFYYPCNQTYYQNTLGSVWDSFEACVSRASSDPVLPDCSALGIATPGAACVCYACGESYLTLASTYFSIVNDGTCGVVLQQGNVSLTATLTFQVLKKLTSRLLHRLTPLFCHSNRNILVLRTACITQIPRASHRICVLNLTVCSVAFPVMAPSKRWACLLPLQQHKASVPSL